MTSPGNSYDESECQDDHRERDQYRERQHRGPSLFRTQVGEELVQKDVRLGEHGGMAGALMVSK